jgi:hypothetical protein
MFSAICRAHLSISLLSVTQWVMNCKMPAAFAGTAAGVNKHTIYLNNQGKVMIYPIVSMTVGHVVISPLLFDWPAVTFSCNVQSAAVGNVLQL